MAATVAPPIGVFGNVRYIEEAGDLFGVEVRFSGVPASPWLN
jgi:hypothetical protein